MKNNPLTKIGVAYHPDIRDAADTAQKVATFLTSKGAHTVLTCSLKDVRMQKAIQNKEIEALVILGGDGSMLRASHLCAAAGIPITGINLGTFGFLFELERTNWQDHISRLVDGSYRLENRMMLQASHYRGEELLGSWQVVNEIVVCRGQQVKPIRLHASVDQYPMASYVADGLIAATATGSTAYALAVNGPIMPPETRNILIVPVAPHLSFDRAVILGEGSCITITVNTSHEAVLSADGREPVKIINKDSVKVSSSAQNIQFIRFHGPGFFYRHLNRYMMQNPSV
ncbi:MAG: putative inorganic polyphosphate/ATP-NAD kinase [Anaerolinea thermophila]|uniref:NAD kinase n=1 Tax=Anaerolinea thermophila TaxID=167964 RepID=A0A101FXA0_9CHLR|nr:MAG: putative inorganic polyphosphate/ATP-NAD kinase [Anaerolinea thermophila]